jgi:trimeric autotransporter adhesin
MKTTLSKIMTVALIGLSGIAVNAQTITAPLGQSLTVTNSIDITVATGSVNVPSDGSYNIGTKSILSNKGTANVFLGESAGPVNTGFNNLFMGSKSGFVNSTGYNNSFIGSDAGGANTTGFANSFLGTSSGLANTTGYSNLFLGTQSGRNNISGFDNSFVGVYAGYNNTTGQRNIFLGTSAGYGNTTGDYNAAFGANSASGNTTGSRNLMLGASAGYTNTTGSDNTYIGFLAAGTPALSNVTAIGSGATASASNTVVLGNAATTITGQGLAGSGLRFPNLTSGSAVTSVPGGRVLSVDGSGNVVLVQLSTTPGATLSVGQPVSDNWKEADGYLYNNSTNGVVIKGTGLDGNSLIVKGGVLSKEVNVKVEGSESWPDYVFQPSYKRMSLDEVEKFITVNKHLPNVPSAAEMAITGNNLGKTDVKLLEKVEELTLYLLEMKKANDAQSAEIQSLKNQMNKLKKNRK